jgi:hypothetical protein
MKKAWLVAPVVFVVLGCSSSEKPSGKEKGGAREENSVVTLDGLKAKPPASWKQEEPRNTGLASFPRIYQFRLPAAEGSEDAELSINKGKGGTAEANVARWKTLFLPPEGKKIDEVSQVEKTKLAGRPMTYIDIRGTYLEGPPRLSPEQKTKRPDYEMLAGMIEGQQDDYFFKLTGPEKTVEKHKKEFEDWLKSFK